MAVRTVEVKKMFDSGLRTYLKKFRFSSVVSEDLLRVLDETLEEEEEEEEKEVEAGGTRIFPEGVNVSKLMEVW